MKILSSYNLSGGVGKSTLTKELGYSLAQAGQRVLLIDLDPQGAMTAFLGVDDKADGNSPRAGKSILYNCIMHGDEGSPVIRAKTDIFDWGLDVAPTGSELHRAEMELVVADMKEMRLRNVIARHPDYDYILIDCQPSMGQLPYIALAASTHVLIPIQTAFKGINGTNILFEMLNRQRQGPNRNLQIAAFVPTLYDKREEHHRNTLDFIQGLSSTAPVMPPFNYASLANRSTYERMPMKALKVRRTDAAERAIAAIDTLTQHVLTL